MAVHVLEDVFDPRLLGVPDRPYRGEAQPLHEGAFDDEEGGAPGAGYEVDPFRVELRDGLREYAMVVGVHHTYTVGADEGSPRVVDHLEDAFFEVGALLCLLPEACRDDDKGLDPLVVGQGLDYGEAGMARDGDDGHLRHGDIGCIVIGLEALYDRLLGIDYVQVPLVVTFQEVTD